MSAGDSADAPQQQQATQSQEAPSSSTLRDSSSHDRSCSLCEVVATPAWRRDKATGKVICNACYLRQWPCRAKTDVKLEQKVKAEIMFETKQVCENKVETEIRRLPARNGRSVRLEEVALVQRLEDGVQIVEPFGEAGSLDVAEIDSILDKMTDWIVQNHRRQPDIGTGCSQSIRQHFGEKRRALAAIASEPYRAFVKKDTSRKPSPTLLSALIWFRAFWMLLKGLDPTSVAAPVGKRASRKRTENYPHRAVEVKSRRLGSAAPEERGDRDEEELQIDDPKAISTDTEYEDIDLNTCPQSISVENSGNEKMDGVYVRMYAPSRGKPCYVMSGGRKPVYMFWYTSWKIGGKLGTKQSFAYVRDVGRKGPPCEPYPRTWMVYRKVAGEDGGVEMKSVAFAVAAMRIIEESETTLRAVKGEPAEAANVISMGAREGASDGDADRSDSDGGKADPGSSSRSESAELERETERAAATLAAADMESMKARAPSMTVPPLHTSKPSKDASSERKAREFESRLRNWLSKLDPEAQQRKIDDTKLNIKKKGQTFLDVTGFTPESLNVMYAGLLKDFGLKAAENLERAAASHKALVAAQVAVPSTPPLDEEGAAEPMQLPHRTDKPLGSSMRPSDKKRDKSRRIDFGDDHDGKEGQGKVDSSTTRVESYKGYGDILWYTAPGAMVFCDTCDKQVPQSLGQLSGSPGKSQFAQNQFVCSDCVG